MLPKISKQALLNEVKSLYSLECSLVQRDELTNAKPHLRNSWNTFIDHGRARREILMFAIREAGLKLNVQSTELVPDYFPEEKFIKNDKGHTIALFQTAYLEVLKDCEALGDARMARKINLAESFIPKPTHKPVTDMTPVSESVSPKTLKIA